MLPEIILLFSLISLSAGVYFVFGAGEALIVAGVYLGIIAFAMAFSRKE